MSLRKFLVIQVVFLITINIVVQLFNYKYFTNEKYMITSKAWKNTSTFTSTFEHHDFKDSSQLLNITLKNDSNVSTINVHPNIKNISPPIILNLTTKKISDAPLPVILNVTTRTVSNASPIEGYGVRKDYPPTVILWTTWRSGSTFLGELLRHANNETYYDYELLLPFGVQIFRDDKTGTQRARNYLSSILKCDTSIYKKLNLTAKRLRFNWNKNKYLLDKCKEMGTKIENTSVHSNICKNAKYHVIKLLRLALVWAHPLLADPALDVKIIYLVRDPRAILRSRHNLAWCGKGYKDCSDPAKVCQHISKDLADAKALREAYPDKFHFIRYEDLSLDVLGTVQNLWKWLNFNLTAEQREEINKLTADDGNTKNVYRVTRDTANHTFSWRFSMDYDLMQQVQDACTDVLDTLGLRRFDNKQDFMNYSIPVFVKAKEDLEDILG